MGYQEIVLQDDPLFYLVGDSTEDRIAGLVGKLLGGVTAGGPSIASGLGDSFVIPDLPNTDPTITAVQVANAPSIQIVGYPAVEFWMNLDRDGGTNQVTPWVTAWMLNDPSANYFGFSSLPLLPTHWIDAEPAFGNAGSDSTVPFRPNTGPWHVVAYVDGSGVSRMVLNGTLLATDLGVWGTSSLAGSLTDLFIGCSGGSFGFPYTGGDRLPGRLSDFAVYAEANSRDMLDLATRHYEAGIAPPTPPPSPPQPCSVVVSVNETPVAVEVIEPTPIEIEVADAKAVEITPEDVAPIGVTVTMPTPIVTEVGGSGPKGNPGDKGDKGDKGDTGPIGPSGVSAQSFSVPAVSSFTIPHGLGRYPLGPTFYGLSGDEQIVGLVNVDVNTLDVLQDNPTAGTVVLA